MDRGTDQPVHQDRGAGMSAGRIRQDDELDQLCRQVINEEKP